MHAYASASLIYDHMIYEHVNKEKHGVRRIFQVSDQSTCIIRIPSVIIIKCFDPCKTGTISTCFQTLFAVHCLTNGIGACQPGLTPAQSWRLPLLDNQSINLCTLRVYGACQQTITENKIHYALNV